MNALTQVSGVGKKTAELMGLELSDKVADLAVGTGGPDGADAAGPGVQEAVGALVALGYSFVDADTAVRRAVAEGETAGTEELIRRALAKR